MGAIFQLTHYIMFGLSIRKMTVVTLIFHLVLEIRNAINARRHSV